MILEILRLARRLDKKLEEKLGRPYRVILSIALITEIEEEVRQLTHASFTEANLIQTLIWILLGVLLLINQLGEMANRMEHRSSRGGRGRGKGGADATETPSLPIRKAVATEEEDLDSRLAD